MKNFDELKTMTETELMSYLKQESQKLITAAQPTNRLKMQALQANCDAIRRKYKNPQMAGGRIFDMMISKMRELRDATRVL